jgi:hypothetical protein
VHGLAGTASAAAGCVRLTGNHRGSDGPGVHNPGRPEPITATAEAGPAQRGTGPSGQPSDPTLHRAEIDQTTGMLIEQLGTGGADAFIRLRAYSDVNDLRLADGARGIVARRLRLRPALS